MEIVDENSEPLIKNKGGRQGFHKWDEWLKHNVTVRLVQGVDFESTIPAFMPQIYNAARRRNGTAHVSKGRDMLDRDILEVTFSFNERYFRDLDRVHKEIEQAPSTAAPVLPEDGLLSDDTIQPGQWGPPPTDTRIDFDNLPFADGRHLRDD
jgi:hypothetical protein